MESGNRNKYFTCERWSYGVENGSYRRFYNVLESSVTIFEKVWRHGDRSPTTTFNVDPFQEDSWTFGGGGWGQLSPVMIVHMELI